MRVFAFLTALAGLALLTAQLVIVGGQLSWINRPDLEPLAYLIATIAQLAFFFLLAVFLLIFAGSRRAH